MNILEVKSPGEIFSGNNGSLKQEYEKLALQYHPDHNRSAKAHEEFLHLQELYKRAQEEMKEGFWESKDVLQFASYHAKFRKRVDLPIGKMYVGDFHVTFFIEKGYKALWDNAVRRIKRFCYASDRMKNEISRYLPSIRTTTELPKYYVLVLNKTPDLILLRDIPFATLPDRGKHVAWVISSLYNLLCYFEYARITHNDISLDTYFISPKYHSGALLGGWWYSCKKGDRLTVVPTDSYSLFSPTMRKTKLADYSLDKELLRAVGRELLGDRAGAKLITNKVAPMPFINWLKCSTSQPAVKEYALWDIVLSESYGKKKFIPMNLTIKDIYGGN
jgi:DnaJ domain